jgi:type I restriction enzyme, S subunit
MKQQTQTNKIEWREIEIGEVLDYEQPTNYIVESIDYKDEYKTPVLTAGKSFILGNTNETNGVCDNLPVIIFDDFTTANKYVNFKFKVKSSAMKILRPKNKLINLKFVFLIIQTLNFDAKRHKRYYLSAYQKIKIPLPFLNNKPDLETQQKIASILEKAKTLKQKRKNSDEILDEYLKAVFWEMFYNKGFEIKGFLDVFNITTGKLDSNAMEENGTYPFFTCSQETFKINKYAFDCEALLLAGNNAAAKYSVKYYKGKFNAYQRTYILTLKEKGNFRYMHFVLTNKLTELQNKSIGSNTKYLTLGILKQIKIPIPPLPLQQKFASIVEKVEKIKERQKRSEIEITGLFDALMQKAFKGELV